MVSRAVTARFPIRYASGLRPASGASAYMVAVYVTPGSRKSSFCTSVLAFSSVPAPRKYLYWGGSTGVFHDVACTSIVFDTSNYPPFVNTTDFYRYAANPVRCVRE